jgi:hypothetical protein
MIPTIQYVPGRALRRKNALSQIAPDRHFPLPRIAKINLLLGRVKTIKWERAAPVASRSLQAFESHRATIVGACRSNLGAIGKRLQQVRQLRVAVLLHELGDSVPPLPATPHADDR